VHFVGLSVVDWLSSTVHGMNSIKEIVRIALNKHYINVTNKKCRSV
jgi:hypothetical protein